MIRLINSSVSFFITSTKVKIFSRLQILFSNILNQLLLQFAVVKSTLTNTICVKFIIILHISYCWAVVTCSKLTF